MPAPDIRSDFERARAAEAAARARREAALTPPQRTAYEDLKSVEAARERERVAAAEAAHEKRLVALMASERTQRGQDLTPAGEGRMSDAEARRRAEAEMHRLETNETNTAHRASRARLDKFLVEAERERNRDRDRDR